VCARGITTYRLRNASAVTQIPRCIATLQHAVTVPQTSQLGRSVLRINIAGSTAGLALHCVQTCVVPLPNVRFVSGTRFVRACTAGRTIARLFAGFADIKTVIIQLNTGGSRRLSGGHLVLLSATHRPDVGSDKTECNKRNEQQTKACNWAATSATLTCPCSFVT
jgi:hypothetical protein